MQTAEEHNAADPFGEFRPAALCRETALLGTRIDFRSHSAELIELVDTAYAGVPAQVLAADRPPLRVDLALVDDMTLSATDEPPAPRMCGGAGLFGAVMDAANFAFVAPGTGGASVSLSRGLLARHSYHARYELLEFAVFTLASRTQGLLPLHGGCVGLRGRGALLIGDSGAGKTTLALQALLAGLDFLTEDAAFVEPQSLRVTGVANFLHPRFDALRFVEPQGLRGQWAASPVIRRRSGVSKFEVDLRLSGGRLAAAPLQLSCIAFLSAAPADGGPLLRPLDAADALDRLRASQPYAMRQPGWDQLEHAIAGLACVELRRGDHPREGVAQLAEALAAR